jgi:hypothetical protein
MQVADYTENFGCLVSMSHPNDPVDAVTPERPRGCLQIGTVTAGRVLVHLLACFLVVEVLCSGFPVVWRYFEQQQVKVPVITTRVYDAYYWMVFYWFIAIPAFVVLDAFLLAFLETRRQPLRWLARLRFATVLMVAIFALTIINMAIVVPFSALAPIVVDEANAADNFAPK